MRNEFTAIVERDGRWYIAYCAEVPCANGQGKTREECLANLGEAIALTQVRHDTIVWVFFEPPNRSKWRGCNRGCKKTRCSVDLPSCRRGCIMTRSAQ